jgi:nitroreductase
MVPVKETNMTQSTTGILPKGEDHRKADHPIETLFLRRWSPRAMSGEPISEEEMMTLFEAARWAPSSYNEQEWRFLYARRDTPQWPLLLGLLVEANRVWCQRAALLSVVIAHKVFSRNGQPNAVHVFDSGTAYENLALQGASMGLVVHGMAGFDFEKARRELAVPDDYAVSAMFAVGRPGNPADLPPQLREYEKPSPRKPVREIIFEGRFQAR